MALFFSSLSLQRLYQNSECTAYTPHATQAHTHIVEYGALRNGYLSRFIFITLQLILLNVLDTCTHTECAISQQHNDEKQKKTDEQNGTATAHIRQKQQPQYHHHYWHEFSKTN